MNKDTFILLAKYNKTVNENMDAIIKTLSPAEWDKDLGGHFKSVRGLCSHLYICDFNWLKRFSKLRDFPVFKEELFSREPYSFSEVLFEDKAEYLAKRPVLDEKIIAFVNGLDEGDFSQMLKYADSSGTPYEKNFGGCVLHTFNHGTFHRGMISLYFELLGRENDFNSLTKVI
jgi:uncharacterized damage-inducible protein DinB